MIVWQRATVESILRNEKYKGSALLQKSFTVDFLTKKTKINEGEVPQYYVEDSHPAIIEPWEWEQVQVELERRKKQPQPSPSDQPLLREDHLCRLRRYFWSKDLALHRPLPPCHLAMQRQVQRGTQMRNTPPDRGAAERTVPGSPWGVSFRPGRRHRPAPLCPADAHGHGLH